MKSHRILLALSMVAATSAPGICAAVSYEVSHDNNPHECGLFLAALKGSRLASLSDGQICAAMNSPVFDVLSSRHIRNIEWLPYPVPTKAEKTDLAKRIQESSIATKDLPHRAKGIALYMAEFQAINASADVMFQQAVLHLEYGTFYALAMKRKACDSNSTDYGALHTWGIFRNPYYTKGAVVEPGQLGGNPFYLDGRLVDLDISPPFWQTYIITSVVKDELHVALWSVGSGVDLHGNPVIGQQIICQVLIHK